MIVALIRGINQYARQKEKEKEKEGKQDTFEKNMMDRSITSEGVMRFCVRNEQRMNLG